MIGRTLLHYQIVEKLGEGGMGVVYKARDLRLNRFVVLKVLREDSIGDQDRNRRFFQEAQAASALNHPNIVTIHDMAVEGGIAFIVMEWIPGRSLDALIGPGGIAPEQVVEYGIQIADALAVAHAAGIIHRDLKPGNIMVTESGLVKLLDFGLAKRTSRDHAAIAAAMTLEGSIVGTVSYMSPEQAMGRTLDLRSDLFSFGTVLYEMLTGRRLFGHASAVMSLTAVLRDKPAAPSSINPRVPAELDRLTLRCLEKEPEMRFGSAAELRAELQRIRSGPARPAPSPVCVEGRTALRGWTARGLAAAKECFERVLRDNSDPATAYACMGEYYTTAALLGLREPGDAMPKAEWAAQKALELDPRSELASLTLGAVQSCFHFNWDAARACFEDLTPHPESRLYRAMWYYRPLGRFQEAHAAVAGNALASAWLSLEQGDFDAAAAHASSAPEPHWIAAWVFAWVLISRGHAPQAVAMCGKALELEPGQPYLRSALATALAHAGDENGACEALVVPRALPSWCGIPVYAALGDADAAFAAAADAVHRRDACVITALRMPGTATVRVGARFAELVRAMNLDRPQSTVA